ncbi:hypothetical protein GOV08_04505 [Candidatus Woesearchaeota archaeon]|nr:hypothetical protein [Candidatus Woesearchaeota archaeon]
MTRIVKKAFKELFPEKDYNYESTIKYSKAFSAYNANVKYTSSKLMFRISHEWKDVSNEIKIGLIQSLLLKIFKEKKKTTQIDLYNIFLKNLHISAPKTNIDPVLKQSFDRVNDKYFAGMMDKTNLIWGEKSFSRLGTYEYGSDTIKISKVLEKDQNLLDYVVYHEMLHKKLKFIHTSTKTRHHTKEFRKKEKGWEDHDVEEKLKDFLRKERKRKLFWF